MKIHLKILAWFYILLCTPLLAVGLILCIGLAWRPDAEAIKALQFVGPPIGFVSVVYLIPGLICGVGLLRGRAWARILGLVLASIQMLLVPFGTALGIYGFWIFLNPEIRGLLSESGPARVAFAAVTNSGGISSSRLFSGKPSVSSLGNLVAPMAIVAGGFFLVLKIGFVLHHDPQPSPIDNFGLTIAAALGFLAGLVTLTFRIVRSAGKSDANTSLRASASEREQARAAARRQAEANFARNDQERLRRVAELAADPVRAKYAPLVERGEVWSDANIAYAEDSGLTNTCPHLQPIEASMRGAGIDARRFRELDIFTQCRIDIEALRRDFDVSAPIRYSEIYAGRPDDNDNPTACLICDEHKSMIRTLHPEESGAMRTPLFPSEGTPTPR